MFYIVQKKRICNFSVSFLNHLETYRLRTANGISCFGSPLGGFSSLVSLGYQDLECSRSDIRLLAQA